MLKYIIDEYMQSNYYNGEKSFMKCAVYMYISSCMSLGIPYDLIQ